MGYFIVRRKEVKTKGEILYPIQYKNGRGDVILVINVGCKTINKLHLSIGVKCILKNNSIWMSIQKDQRIFSNFLSANA